MRESYCLEKNFGFKKFYGLKGGYHVFSSEFFGLTVPENFVGIPSMFQKFWVSKIFMLQRGGYHVLRQKFFSHSIKNFRWGTLRCFRKTRVLQHFMHEKGISLNSVENILSHSANKSCRRTL